MLPAFVAEKATKQVTLFATIIWKQITVFKEDESMKKESLGKGLLIAAVCLYIACAYAMYKGHDKMYNYYSSEYSFSSNVNAYVGGDAYNYIINGTYATAYYVLAMGYLITGTLFGGAGLYLSDGIRKKEEKPAESSSESVEYTSIQQ